LRLVQTALSNGFQESDTTASREPLPRHGTCTKSFLAFTGPPADYWHFQPSSGKANKEFHIIIDMDRVGHSGPLPDFPHEIYRVAKIENEI